VRICLVSAALPDASCGIGDYTDRLAAAMAHDGADVTVVTTAQAGLRTPRGYAIRPVATDWSFGGLPRLCRTILAARPEIVHIQFPGNGYGRGFGVTSLPWALLTLRPRLPVALTLHEFDALTRRQRLRIAAGAVPVRLTVTPSPGVDRSVRRYLGWRPWSGSARIGIASNIEPAVGGEAPAVDFRRRPDELVVGYWGFVRPDKGLEWLIPAFARVRAARPARLVLAGDPGPDLDHVHRVRELMDQAGIAADVVFTGALPAERLSASLRGFDVCVLPFRDGLSGNRGSYSTAVAHGLPVVTTSRDASMLGRAGSTWYVRPRDSAGLAEAILAQAETPRGPLSAAVADEWEWIASRHLALYSGLVKS
jgi:glycosyltransferase involved in cell wall biosynthesis